MSQIKNISTGELTQVSETPIWKAGVWECGNLRFVDIEKAIYEPIPGTNGLTLTPTPPEFLLLLTLQERVAIRAARATDLVVDDLLQMVEDPRLTFVELTNPSVIEAINYLTTIEPPLLMVERAARVLSGLSATAGQAQ